MNKHTCDKQNCKDESCLYKKSGSVVTKVFKKPLTIKEAREKAFEQLKEYNKKICDDFIKLLGGVKKNDECDDGFYIICKKCFSLNVIKYDDTAMGSEYTGMYGDAGLKCLSCGNAVEI